FTGMDRERAGLRFAPGIWRAFLGTDIPGLAVRRLCHGQVESVAARRAERSRFIRVGCGPAVECAAGLLCATRRRHAHESRRTLQWPRSTVFFPSWILASMI